MRSGQNFRGFRPKMADEDPVADKLTFMLAGFLILVMLIGGGVTAFNILFLLQLLVSCSLLTVLILRERPVRLAAAIGWQERSIFACIFLLPLLQLVPLPPALWQLLPMSELNLAIRSEFGLQDSWYPVSSAPYDTAVSVFAIFMLAIVSAAVLRLSHRGQRLILQIIVAVAFVSVPVGAVQIASAGRIFDFHQSNYGTLMIGFLANRNHAGLFLAGAIPLYAHLLYTSPLINLNQRHTAMIFGALILMAGIVGTGSRAGLILGCIGCMYPIAQTLLSGRLGTVTWKAKSLLACIPLIALVALSMSPKFWVLLGRFQGVTDDLRWTIWQTSWRATERYWPIGSGFGTFTSAYNLNEPIENLAPEYINNAHNDFLELAIEGGIFAVSLTVITLALIIWRTIQVVSDEFKLGVSSQRIAALGFPWFAILHSAVDYPMRRMAIVVPVVVLLVIAFGKHLPQNDRTILTT